MTTMTMKSSDLPRAEASLRDAVASGSPRKIDAAGRRLIKARDAAARKAARARDRAAAELQVAAERRDREREAKALRADRIEAELRKREPWCEVHCADGRVIRIRLAHESALGRGTAVEAARRAIYQACFRYQDAVVASRGALATVPERRWLAEMLESTAGLLPARKHGLVSITDEGDAADRG